MTHYVPRQLFFTTGVGVHREKLVSFELALRSASIHRFNLVTVSSILPPHCDIVSVEEGLAPLSAGEIVFCVLSQNATREPGQPVTASVGLAIPARPSQHGYLSEHHACHETEEESGTYAEQLAVVMLATAVGLPDRDYSGRNALAERPDLREYIQGSRSVTQHAIGDAEGRWTTTVAAAVFVP